jgi:hypothetical protein
MGGGWVLCRRVNGGLVRAELTDELESQFRGVGLSEAESRILFLLPPHRGPLPARGERERILERDRDPGFRWRSTLGYFLPPVPGWRPSAQRDSPGGPLTLHPELTIFRLTALE